MVRHRNERQLGPDQTCSRGPERCGGCDLHCSGPLAALNLVVCPCGLKLSIGLQQRVSGPSSRTQPQRPIALTCSAATLQGRCDEPQPKDPNQAIQAASFKPPGVSRCASTHTTRTARRGVGSLPEVAAMVLSHHFFCALVSC